MTIWLNFNEPFNIYNVIIRVCSFYVYTIIITRVLARDVSILDPRLRRSLFPILFSYAYINSVPLQLQYENSTSFIHSYGIAAAFGALFAAIVTYFDIIEGFSWVQAADKENMAGKVVIVTGANAGIGYHTTQQLLETGAKVILACRSKERATKAMNSLSAIDKAYTKRMIFLQCDLSDCSSVRNFVKSFAALKLPLHVLINNAGLLQNTWNLTKDKSMEVTMACNYFGHFLLTNLLLPHLKRQESSRIINVSSCMHFFAFGDPNDDLTVKEGYYYTFKPYSQSKLCQLLFTHELRKRTAGKVQVYAVHPGIVRSEIFHNMPWLLRTIYSLGTVALKVFLRSGKAGAYTTVYTAVTRESLLLGSSPKKNSWYFSDCRLSSQSSKATNDAMASKLWENSCKVVGMTE